MNVVETLMNVQAMPSIFFRFYFRKINGIGIKEENEELRHSKESVCCYLT
jgi:hypothetical protein